MSTCGYICPKCEGRNVLENGDPCDWCQTVVPETETTTENDINNDDWLKSVHEGCGCSDN